jgi:hypothetical protein
MFAPRCLEFSLLVLFAALEMKRAYLIVLYIWNLQLQFQEEGSGWLPSLYQKKMDLALNLLK